MKNLKKYISNIKPEHDTPVGLIHPYWARKPLNVIEALINSYSKPGDDILDPFMGSGTTIVAALKNNRNAVGCDLSPVSNLIVSSIIDGFNGTSKLRECILHAVDDWIKYSLYLYQLENNKCVEREFYRIDGFYVDGNFTINLSEAKISSVINYELKGKKDSVKNLNYKNEHSKVLLNKPINFSKIKFVENTRIAVHRGAKASDFFTNRNMVFINYAKNYIKKYSVGQNEKRILDLFLSSLIPMLRLSDKKASSQWPYWRPKNELTSRNPIVAISKRKKAFEEYFNWLDEVASKSNASAKVFHSSAQNITKQTTKKFDLILTDPPYADHAPYMEYSDLYWSIVGKGQVRDLWSEEIVKTNAVGRARDTAEYGERLKASIANILQLLKDNGYFIFFYLDKNIYHWNCIKEALFLSGCVIEDVYTIPKQRRSMKTVTTPGKTLDGDLIVVCKKNKVQSNQGLPKSTISKILDSANANTYFDKFGVFIKQYLMTDVLDADEWNLKDISRIF